MESLNDGLCDMGTAMRKMNAAFDADTKTMVEAWLYPTGRVWKNVISPLIQAGLPVHSSVLDIMAKTEVHA